VSGRPALTEGVFARRNLTGSGQQAEFMSKSAHRPLVGQAHSSAWNLSGFESAINARADGGSEK